MTGVTSSADKIALVQTALTLPAMLIAMPAALLSMFLQMRRRCLSAWGPDADRHDKSLNHTTLEGSCFGYDSFLMKFADDCGSSNGESAPCGQAFEFHR